MNSVPHRYRNVINPWQTAREIRAAVKYLDRLLRDVLPHDLNRFTRVDEGPRSW